MDKKNQEVTTEELAEMAANGFREVHERLRMTATKDDLAEMKTEILENFRALHQDTSGQFSSFLNSIRKDFGECLDQVEEDVPALQLHG